VFQIVGGVDQADVYSYTGNLSGVRPVRIGGTLFTLSTRSMAYYDPYVLKATQYVYEFMQAQGLAVDYPRLVR